MKDLAQKKKGKEKKAIFYKNKKGKKVICVEQLKKERKIKNSAKSNLQKPSKIPPQPPSATRYEFKQTTCDFTGDTLSPNQNYAFILPERSDKGIPRIHPPPTSQWS